LNRVLLWASAAIVLGFAFFPSYVGFLFDATETLAATGEKKTAADSLASQEIVLPIKGMTCSGCETSVKQALSAVPGVLGADVSYSTGRAVLQIDGGSPPSKLALSAAVAKAGYQVGAQNASTDNPALATTSHPASGQWRAQVESDGSQVEIILDISTLNGERWVGEIDIPDEGLEDYPLEVRVTADSLHVRFGSIAFDGVVSADGTTFTALVVIGDESEIVELTRAGDPEFSETFLELEAVADDPDAVQALSGSGEELREQFNQDTDKVRLLMLLAPS
jgi:copper chaperone CopZ